jgi:gas vesicle protein
VDIQISESVEVRMSRDDWQGTGIGIVIGVGVGVALGMLFATKTGEQTREAIAENVKDGFNRAMGKGKDISNRLQDKFGDVKDQVDRAADAGEQFYRDARSGNL